MACIGLSSWIGGAARSVWEEERREVYVYVYVYVSVCRCRPDDDDDCGELMGLGSAHAN